METIASHSPRATIFSMCKGVYADTCARNRNHSRLCPIRLSASICISTRTIREAARLSCFKLIDKQFSLELNIRWLVSFLASNSLGEVLFGNSQFNQQLHNNPHPWRDIVSGRRSSVLKARSTRNAARSSANYQRRSPSRQSAAG